MFILLVGFLMLLCFILTYIHSTFEKKQKLTSALKSTFASCLAGWQHCVWWDLDESSSSGSKKSKTKTDSALGALNVKFVALDDNGKWNVFNIVGIMPASPPEDNRRANSQ